MDLQAEDGIIVKAEATPGTAVWRLQSPKPMFHATLYDMLRTSVFVITRLLPENKFSFVRNATDNQQLVHR